METPGVENTNIHNGPLTPKERFFLVLSALKFGQFNSSLDLLNIIGQREELRHALHVANAMPLGRAETREDFQDILLLQVSLVATGFMMEIGQENMGMMGLTVQAALGSFEEFAKKHGFYDPVPVPVHYIEDSERKQPPSTT